ncbi:MAG: hypothetical protein ACKOXU_13415 [Limnohabitans sp.]
MTAIAKPTTAQDTTPAKTPGSAKRATTAKKAAPVKAKRVTAKKLTPQKTQRVAQTKAVKPAAPAKVVQAVAPSKVKNKKETAAPVVKEKKVKVVRDSFTIPKNEFTQLGEMKKRALGLGLDIKKSELIRAGLMLLNTATDAGFKKALAAVPTLKTGRPGKG